MTPKKAQLAKELDMLCMYWNTLYGTKFRSFTNALNNYVKIRMVYTLQEVMDAIGRIKTHPFWFDKMPHNPLIMFRLKKTNGEPVDYIANLLTEQPMDNNRYLEKLREQLMKDGEVLL